MRKSLKKFNYSNPNWPILSVLLIPLCCLGWYLSLSLGNPKYSYDPIISPSGDLIAFECIYLYSSDYADGLKNDGIFIYPKRDICIQELANGEIRRITNDQGKYSPNWSSDGSRLAWVSVDNKYELVVWNRLSDEYQKFTLPKLSQLADFDYDYLEWIRNDTQIVVQGLGIVFDIDERSFQTINIGIDEEDVRYLVTSPDGEYSVAVWNYEDLEDVYGYSDVYKFGVYDKSVKMIDDISLEFEVPSWSRNSEYICLIKTVSDDRGVWSQRLVIAEASTGASIELDIPEVKRFYYPLWTNNDSQIVFAVYDDEIHTLDLLIRSNPFDVEILNHRVADVTPEAGSNPLSISSDGSIVTYATAYGQDLIVEYINE